MNELDTLVPDGLWVRWRLHAGGQIAFYGEGGRLLAVSTTVGGGRKRGAISGLVNYEMSNEREFESYDWQFCLPHGGPVVCTVRRRTIPGPLMGSTAVEYELGAADGAIVGVLEQPDSEKVAVDGWTGRPLKHPEWRSGRPLSPVSGPRCRYVPEPKRNRFGDRNNYSASARVMDGDRRLATVFRDTDENVPPVLVPTSGMFDGLDFGVIFVDGLNPFARLTVLAATVVDTHARDDKREGGPGGAVGNHQAKPAGGTNRHQARAEERQRSRDSVDINRDLDRIQQIARRHGNNALAERLERKRRGTNPK